MARRKRAHPLMRRARRMTGPFAGWLYRGRPAPLFERPSPGGAGFAKREAARQARNRLFARHTGGIFHDAQIKRMTAEQRFGLSLLDTGVKGGNRRVRAARRRTLGRLRTHEVHAFRVHSAARRLGSARPTHQRKVRSSPVAERTRRTTVPLKKTATRAVKAAVHKPTVKAEIKKVARAEVAKVVRGRKLRPLKRRHYGVETYAQPIGPAPRSEGKRHRGSTRIYTMPQRRRRRKAS